MHVYSDHKIVSFNEDESFRYLRVKDGYLIKRFLNADVYFIRAEDGAKLQPGLNSRMGVSIGKDTNERLTELAIDLIVRGKKRAEVTDIDLVNTTCNLQCEYCSVRDRDHHNVYHLPSPEIVQPLLDLYQIRSCNFIGGDCLTEWDRMQILCEYLNKTHVKKFSVFTNGVLLDQEKLKFFASMDKMTEIYIPIYTTKGKGNGHYNIDEFIERLPDWSGFPNIKFTINLIVGYEPFDADDLIKKLSMLINEHGFYLVINSMLDQLDSDQLKMQINNYENIIDSPYLDDIHIKDDRSEYIGTACSGFNVSACSEGYSTCSMATFDTELKPHKTVEGVHEVVDRQIISSCEGCSALKDDGLCADFVRTKQCQKLNQFNCYYCPDLGRCSYLRCTYRMAIHMEPVEGSMLGLSCLCRQLSRLIIEYLNEKDKIFSGSDWLYEVPLHKVEG